ncbi:MAG: MFS transporter [SAR202 cluster bacterium]|jgi:MFS family permease|nr:MFS transporter [Dehalococcoidia bacterium]MQG27759.1 MFS transporter [SAR202 cluster bacterium]|tara:strand:+ start:2522 stop:3844 length:1323 start_codon:yes stop_codon:yes gene_type:complete
MLLAPRLRDTFPFYYGWIVVGASSTVVFARMAPAITTLTVLIFPISHQLGWSRTLIAGSVSAGALASLVLSPVVGWAIDRFGARPVLVVSVLVLGVAMISLAWATVPLTFYLAFAAGRIVFHTSAPIGASTVAARWFIRKRGRAIGMIFLFGAIGGVVFTMVASLVVESHGLKATWIAMGLVVLVFSVAPSLLLVAERPEDIGLLPDGEPPDSTDAEKGAGAIVPVGVPDSPATVLPRAQMTADTDSWTLGEAVRTKTFWLLVFMGFASFFVHTSIGVHMGAYFRDVGLGATSAALAVSLSWSVSAVGSLIWGWVTDRIDVRYAYSGMFLFQAGSTLYLIFVGGTLGVFLASGLFGIVSAGTNVVPSVIYANYFGRSSLGRIRGLGEVGVLLGQATGPVIAGILFDLRGGYSTIFTAFVVLALVCSLLVLKARAPVKAVI